MNNKRYKAIVSGFVLGASLVLSTPLVAFAEDKTTTVTLPQNSKNLEFKVTLENNGAYTGKMIAPDGKEYPFTPVGENQLTVVVPSAKKGDWVASVSSEGSVGKYTLNVTGKADTTTAAVDDSIKVGEDLVGLSVTFRDRTVAGTWQDTGIDSVSVNIINVDTQEVLYKERISKDTRFECDLPDGVNHIAVRVVPSQSENVEGAAKNIALDVPARPSSTVTFPENIYVNGSSATVNVHLDGRYGFYVEDGGEQSYTDEVHDAGDYEVSIPLIKDGENKVSFYLVDENGNMFSYPTTLIRDTVAPVLKMEKNYDSVSTKAESITLTGKVEDFTKLTVNDNEVKVATDGGFDYNVDLHVGDNNIVVSAYDEAGNVTSYSYNIIRTEQKRSPFPLIGGVLATIGLIGFIIFDKKSKKGGKKTSKTPGIKEATKKDNTTKEEKVKEKKVKSAKVKKTPDVSTDNEEGIKHSRIYQYVNTHRNSSLIFGTYFLILYLIFSFLLAPIWNKGSSMEPTIKDGSFAIGNRLAYVKHSPKRGDIIAFEHNDKNGYGYSKRVIGLPGDKITFHDGYVYINDELYDESAYLGEDVETNCDKEFEVPEDCVFVLGDNREGSTDSRAFENPYIKYKEIRAKQIFYMKDK